jgi:hypothetical protein
VELKCRNISEGAITNTFQFKISTLFLFLKKIGRSDDNMVSSLNVKTQEPSDIPTLIISKIRKATRLK